MDKIRNDYINENLKLASVTEIIKSGRVSWYGLIMRKEYDHVAKKTLGMKVDDKEIM